MEEFIFNNIEKRRGIFKQEEYDIVLSYYEVIRKAYLMGMFDMYELFRKESKQKIQKEEKIKRKSKEKYGINNKRT